MVCPCDLFMVIAKLSLTGNCFLLSTKGNPELAFVFNLILSKNALFLALLPVRISTSNIFLNKPRHNNHVSLHWPRSMFCNNIKGAPYFTFKICGGILPWTIEFGNSCWYGCIVICFFLPYLSMFNPPVLFPLLFDFYFILWLLIMILLIAYESHALHILDASKHVLHLHPQIQLL